MEAAAAASGLGDSGVFLAIAPFYFAFTYFFLFWDSRRPDSPTKEDGQILLKTVLCFVVIVGVGIAAGGLITLMHYLLSGAKTGTPELKKGLAGVIAGAIPFLTAVFALLPRTNHKQHAKAVRFMFGFLGAAGAMVGFAALKGVIENLILSAGWPATAGAVATFLVMTGIGLFSIFRLGGMSSWTAPVRPVAQMPQQHSQGYPPQGGYAPQGYPPQGYGGGYGAPPQGGGYPPQGGGYPPQGGGGGGYPPGGYQPR